MEIHLARPECAQGGTSGTEQGRRNWTSGNLSAPGGQKAAMLKVERAKSSTLAGQTHGWAQQKGVSNSALGFFSRAKDNSLTWTENKRLPHGRTTKAPEYEAKCRAAIINIYICWKRGRVKHPGRPLIDCMHPDSWLWLCLSLRGKRESLFKCDLLPKTREKAREGHTVCSSAKASALEKLLSWCSVTVNKTTEKIKALDSSLKFV